jgi:hypothetical protein
MIPKSTLAVTAAASSLAVCDLATVRADLGIAGGDTSQDARLTRLIVASAAAFNKYCGRVFMQQTYAETWRLPTSPSQYWQTSVALDPIVALPPSAWPVVSVTSIVEAGVTLDPSLYLNAKTLDGAQPGRGLIRLDATGAESTWARGVNVATYVAGFNAPTVVGGNAPLPADLYEAALLDVRARFYAKDNDPARSAVIREETPDLGLTIYDVGGGFGELGLAGSYGITPAALVTLDAYRLANWAT